MLQTITRAYDMSILDSVLTEDKFCDIPLSRKKQIITELKEDIAELYDIEVSQIYDYVSLMSLRLDLLKASRLNKFQDKLLIQDKITQLEQKLYSTEEQYEVTWGD